MRSTLPTFNEVWQQQLAQRIKAQLDLFAPQRQFVVACSGGIDSVLLLYVMAVLCPARLRCIYIDHQLQHASAAWGQTVAAHAARLNIACEIEKVTVAPRGNTEQQARSARYAAFARMLQAHEVLLTAHHQQDHTETVLLRLFNGSGVTGLSGIAALSQQQGLCIWRPFLDLSREHIEQWAVSCHIQAVTDPMNHNAAYDRVWCRQQLWPVLQSRFAHMQAGIARSAALMQDAASILAEVCSADLAQCADAQAQDSLNLLRLAQLSPARQRQLLSRWMQGDTTYRPALHMVDALQHSVIAAKADAQALLHWNGIQFRRYQQRLFRLDAAAQARCAQMPAVVQYLTLQALDTFQVAATPKEQHWYWQKLSTQMGLSENLLGQTFTLKPRLGGEQVHLQGRVGRWPLKKAIQAAQILPWFRHTIQILYCDNVILGVFTPQGFWLAQSSYTQVGGWLPVMQHATLLPSLIEQTHDSTTL